MHKSLNTKNVSSTKFCFGLLMLSTGNELYMTHLGKSKPKPLAHAQLLQSIAYIKP